MVKVEGRQPFGMCQAGVGFIFHAPAVAAMNADLVAALVAHELAHACFHAQELEHTEEHARQLATSWGFDQAGLDAKQRAWGVAPLSFN